MSRYNYSKGRMPSWILKPCVQRSVGALPAAHFWNELLQQYISRSQNFTDEKFNDRLDACRIHLEHFRSRWANSRQDQCRRAWDRVVPSSANRSLALWSRSDSNL